MAEALQNKKQDNSENIQSGTVQRKTKESTEVEKERNRILKVLEDHKNLITLIVTDYNAIFREMILETNEVAARFTQFGMWRNRYPDSKDPKGFGMAFVEIDKNFGQLNQLFNAFNKKSLVASDTLENYFRFMEAEFRWLEENVKLANMAVTLEQLGKLRVPKEECQHKKSKTDWVYCRALVAPKPNIIELVTEWKHLLIPTKVALLFRQMQEVIRFIGSNGDF